MGHSFPFFGVEYSSVYVGSNGYVTFDRADRTYYSHRYYHFRYPRVSCMFMDLSPNRGGKVAYEVMDDKFVVTFEDVPRYGRAWQTQTFQTELFYDGHVRCSYGANTATSDRVIAGVSGGAAIDLNYNDQILRDLDSEAVTDAHCPVVPYDPTGFGTMSIGKGPSQFDMGSLGVSSNSPAICPVMATLPVAGVTFFYNESPGGSSPSTSSPSTSSPAGGSSPGSHHTHDTPANKAEAKDGDDETMTTAQIAGFTVAIVLLALFGCIMAQQVMSLRAALAAAQDGGSVKLAGP